MGEETVSVVHPVTGQVKEVTKERAEVLKERGWNDNTSRIRGGEKPEKPDVEAGRARLDAEAGRVTHVEPVSQTKPAPRKDVRSD